MANEAAFLGIDCGTQGTKALLLQRDGVALGRGYAKHEIIERANGAREQQPQWWVDALKVSVAAAMAAHPHAAVRAIGVSGQQHGLVVLDEQQQVIRPAKLWNDTETAPQNAELVAAFGGPAQWIERFGIVPLTGYTVSKLLWLKEMEPENLARVRHILLPHEYLNMWLTGQMRAEYGDASGTGYFDPRSRKWIPEVLDWIDGGSGQLRAAIPELLTPEQSVGTVRPEVATELGLPQDCTVSSGGGDNMMGALGTGNVQQGVVTMSLGTSSTVYSFRNAPAEDRSGSVAPFCSSSGGWLPLVCTMNATNVVTQTVELVRETVAALEPALRDTPPGADGLVWLPFLNGERTPDLPTARGALLGVSANNYTRQHLIRAMVEGVSFGMLAGLELILQGAAAERIVLIGGGSKSAAWRQLLADATGAVIQVPAEEEAGCLGAAIQAIYAHAQATGEAVTFQALAERYVHMDEVKTAKPDAAKREPYRAAMQAYRQELHRLFPETAKQN
ncbi:xylulokinase [Terriglobus sp.]|uniref:xylulokinase n=1 Tax=Terriglobus sp. TaxID=1889013 RepID=UPI003AFFD369